MNALQLGLSINNCALFATLSIRASLIFPPTDISDLPSSYRKTMTTTTQEVYSYRKGSVTTKLYGRDLSEYEDIDIDSLLTKLTPEELEELNSEVDPDNSLLPPSQRCRDQTTKSPTGPFRREELLKFLEEKAKNEADWEEKVPFKQGVKRGKAYVPSVVEEKKETFGIDLAKALEMDEVEIALSEATENDLVDLAGILGMHSMLTQTQYHNVVKGKSQDEENSSFSGMLFISDEHDDTAVDNCVLSDTVVKSTPLKFVPDEPANNTDVLDCIRRLNENDPSLTEVNINNMKTISRENVKKLIEAAKCSTHLENFFLANTALSDADAHGLIELLEMSKSLKNLNVESNFLTGEFLIALLQATLKQQCLVEIHVENQRAAVLGNKVEMELARIVEENDSLLRVGISFQSMDARYRVSYAIEKNYERLRLQRVQADEE
ncbi:Rad21 / Rec8 like protein [Trichinella spiralis]|uniref:Tropomodulin n=1 Tax=Trichinella spiralis TaxID=6334 RepID=E5SKS3_TRISP|nr:Rad21 / Rec8 like protein [Trichinella spiralis]KRY28331.1 Tropomodulin [Trichinella spiralis]